LLSEFKFETELRFSDCDKNTKKINATTLAIRPTTKRLDKQTRLMTIDNNVISAIGLIFDMIGIIVIFIFGISPRLTELTEKGNLSLGEPSEKEVLYNKLNKLGLGLVVVGFLFQLVGNNAIYDILKNVYHVYSCSHLNNP
jgi:hypothetical protein